MALEFSCETVIPANPSRVYHAWLDGKEHGEMTGADAEGAPVVGSNFRAWGGYISGRNLELVEGERIVQA